MAGEELILAFDFGTSGVKAVLTTLQANIKERCSVSYPLYTPQANYAEQDPEEYWKAACQAVKILTESEVYRSIGRIRAVSLCTQGMGLIPVDREGNVLRPNITWLDNRAKAQADEINQKLGCPYLTAASVAAKIRWIQQNELELYERTSCFLDCTGYINFRLTGKLSMELTNSSPYSLDRQELSFKKRVYEAAGIDLERMPPLFICSQLVGTIEKKAAEEMGIPEGICVYMGSGDVPATAAGAGCCRQGDVHVCLASSGWMSAVTNTRRLPALSPGIYQIYGVDRETLVYGGGIQQAGFLQDWAIRQFYCQESKEMGRKIYRFLEQETAKIPAGSGRMLVTPWLCGESCPVSDEKARAVFFNITGQHDRRYFLNALMEGVCYSLRWMMDDYRQDTGKETGEIRAVGGCAVNTHWMQMLADVLQIPVHVPEHVTYTGAVGSAMIAGVGMGLYTFAESTDFVKIERSYYPNRENREIYQEMYTLFQKLYPTLKPLYDSINTNP